MKQNKLKKIKLVLLDVDGVLTAGEVIYNDKGEETKIFNVKDGLGIRMLMEVGIEVGIITGRRSKALVHRCDNLKINHLMDGIRDKVAAFEKLLKTTGYAPDQTLFMGDDLPDLPVMKVAGVSAAVSDAHEIIIKQADIITDSSGGNGAVREICEAILKSQGLWEDLVKRLF